MFNTYILDTRCVIRIYLMGIAGLFRIAYVVYRMSLEEAKVGISQLMD